MSYLCLSLYWPGISRPIPVEGDRVRGRRWLFVVYLNYGPMASVLFIAVAAGRAACVLCTSSAHEP